GARLHRLLPEPVQPAPDRLPGRRLDRAQLPLPPPRRRARPRLRRRRAVRRPRARADRGHVRRVRTTAPPVTEAMEDRRILERREPDVEAEIDLIADEFREGFEAVDRI